jgi:hypothetical protein
MQNATTFLEKFAALETLGNDELFLLTLDQRFSKKSELSVIEYYFHHFLRPWESEIYMKAVDGKFQYVFNYYIYSNRLIT